MTVDVRVTPPARDRQTSAANALPPRGRAAAVARQLGPGIALSAAVAIVAALLEPVIARLFKAGFGWSYTLPAIVIALFIGIALHGIANRPQFQPGIAYCVKKLLRIAIGLLGLRIAIGDIIGLGLGTALLVVLSMVATIVAGFWLARLFDRDEGYGALAGAATAVCGASATLATATALPDYKNKEADTVFTVIAANAVSTIVMVLYPPLCIWLGLSALETGVMLGATIHDMAQVVGAGYAVSEPVGNAAVIVKLFRVFLLLPVVLIIGWWFTRTGAGHGSAKVPVPVFALVFLVLALVNSVVPGIPALADIYAPVKAILGEASRWGLLIAIGALGLGTSMAAVLQIGWRHVAVFTGTTLVILVVATAGIVVLR
jgi:uncharacterized integral membrane protein (TIGR00698 family)